MTLKKIAALLLALLLISSFALADSVTGVNGDSWVRSGPGLDYEKLTVLGEGESGEYLGSTSTDSRGVDWYRVRYNGINGWVSSRYTALSGSGWGDEDFSWETGDTRYVRAMRKRAFMQV